MPLNACLLSTLNKILESAQNGSISPSEQFWTFTEISQKGTSKVATRDGKIRENAQKVTFMLFLRVSQKPASQQSFSEEMITFEVRNTLKPAQKSAYKSHLIPPKPT